MKNKKLDMLVKASILSRKGATIFFCCFMVIATILVLVSAGAVTPLKNNIDQNINNHILNRELNFEINENTPQNEIDDTILSIKSIEHITSVYNVPAELDVSETSGVLFSAYTLSYVHEGYNLKITSGRAFKENEENVAVVPEVLKDFNNESIKLTAKRLWAKILFSLMNRVRNISLKLSECITHLTRFLQAIRFLFHATV